MFGGNTLKICKHFINHESYLETYGAHPLATVTAERDQDGVPVRFVSSANKTSELLASEFRNQYDQFRQKHKRENLSIQKSIVLDDETVMSFDMCAVAATVHLSKITSNENLQVTFVVGFMRMLADSDDCLIILALAQSVSLIRWSSKIRAELGTEIVENVWTLANCMNGAMAAHERHGLEVS
ncbi:hypothetical protein [Rubellimicrobium aerolatum]|uniref:Uncharacterized protein n=1 Tax=Rubellimicrobium aerolatum TaxID=490979 RepID=A0ABW0S8U6_9RHOB|nr:hypothetical protein [Rubellimicrobium aerolatum]MBP1804730.1 hypothetical protein [Rubellimicrobium aerolatum]